MKLGRLALLHARALCRKCACLTLLIDRYGQVAAADKSGIVDRADIEANIKMMPAGR